MKFIIDYEPTPKSMPRVAFINHHARTFYSETTTNALDTMRELISTMKLKPFPPHVALKLDVTFWRTKSKWLPKRETMPFRKPDTDNCIKTVLDSISPILVPDDAQFTSINARKRWSTNGHGYIVIDITEDTL
jgi:Holliday junction resolvase RusA-like endonuclease